MDLNATSENITALLVASLAVLSMIFLIKKKYDSNLPLLFYFVAVVFTSMSDKSVNLYLMFIGLAFAMLLRFEFMNQGFAKIVAFFATASMGLIVYELLDEVFGTGQAPF